MTTFHAPLPSMSVALHDEQGNRIGRAQFRGGQWTAPDDAQADALRRAHVFGVEEHVEGALKRHVLLVRNPRTPKAGKTPPRQKHGAITGTPHAAEAAGGD